MHDQREDAAGQVEAVTRLGSLVEKVVTAEDGHPVAAQRGQLFERVNDRTSAVSAYRQFLALWAEADSSLEPQREQARAALRRLGAAQVIAVRSD